MIPLEERPLTLLIAEMRGVDPLEVVKEGQEYQDQKGGTFGEALFAVRGKWVFTRHFDYDEPLKS